MFPFSFASPSGPILLSLLLLMLATAGVRAQEVTPHRIQTAIEQFVHAELAAKDTAPLVLNLPNPDPRLRLGDCARLKVRWSVPPQGDARARVEVSCAADAGWRLQFPLSIARKRWVVVAARPLVPRSVIAAEDIGLEERVVPEGGSAWLDRIELAVGQELRGNLRAGTALTPHMLLPPKVIKSGEVVMVSVAGGSFSISSEGVALADARLGESVRLRMPSGRIISAIAREPGRAELLQ